MSTQTVKGITFPAGVRDLRAYEKLLRRDLDWMKANAARRAIWAKEINEKEAILAKVEKAK